MGYGAVDINQNADPGCRSFLVARAYGTVDPGRSINVITVLYQVDVFIQNLACARKWGF
jgi:hypothetical protein